ncbi:MAG TPA: RNA polymerase sigma factor [Bryobacteraceae bacterium]|nr:RNA polymerase sigma factor [Bryobacteraceae bacterium]
MEQALSIELRKEQQGRLSEIFQRERQRLLSFIQRRVANAGDAEDIVQDVFYQLMESYELMRPVEHVSAWLYQAAKNRIIDLFRRHRRRPEGLYVNQDDDNLGLETLLPSPEADPAEVYVRGVLLDELDAALDELPPAQREVFVAHELEGRSFPELARESGVNVNTLLSRKRYAVLYLRQRLDAIYREFMRR